MNARLFAALFLIALSMTACGDQQRGAARVEDAPSGTLQIVAESESRWTGVAVTKTGRLFVNYPRWSDDVPISVAEIKDGKPVPFPDKAWNAWTPDKDPSKHHVCVQSVTVDNQDRLWVLDPANPKFGGVVPGGAKLARHDLDGSVEFYRFADSVVLPGSYLNDVRVDTAAETAYITDSGAGGLVVLDLKTGVSRRVLHEHASTMAEDIDVTIESMPWQRAGKTPQVHADGIGLSPDRQWIYYQALTGRTMYRVPTEALRDASLPAAELAARVEQVAQSGVSDGLIFDAAGNLYLSSLEENAVNKLTPNHTRQLVVRDERLSWPDSFALGSNGWIYVSTAQIHRGEKPQGPFRVWRFKP